jgi:lipoate-protein ligase A
MPAGRLYMDQPRPAAEALARGAALAATLTPERPAALYCCEPSVASVVLGAYQHAGHALRPEAFEAIALPVVHRRTGGAAVFCAPGVLYVALALHDASVLMACPPGRILNRNVRGMLAGLRTLSVPAHYFGRDFVSVNGDPCVYVGWDEDAGGRVLLEFFVGVETVFALPPGIDGYGERSEPALRGKTPTTLRAARAHYATMADVEEAVVRGYGQGFGLELERAQLDDAAIPVPRIDVRDTRGLSWSRPHEEAIGFVSAGVRLDANGTIAQLEVGGDFFAQRECAAQLAARLTGSQPDPEAIGAALDAVYAARPGLIEGVRSLTSLRSAILDAVERARGGSSDSPPGLQQPTSAL